MNLALTRTSAGSAIRRRKRQEAGSTVAQLKTSHARNRCEAHSRSLPTVRKLSKDRDFLSSHAFSSDC